MISFVNLTLLCYLSINLLSSNFTKESDLNSSIHKPIASSNYISDWESISGWTQIKEENAIFYITNYSLPKVLSASENKGEILVFVKGYLFQEGLQEDKPLSPPFYTFSNNETAKTPYQWNKIISSEQVQIQVQMTSDVETSFSQAKDKLQIRCFRLSPAFLKSHKLSPQSLHKLSYQQVVNLTGTTP